MKKSRKKRLNALRRGGSREAPGESFLVLFLKKELLPSSLAESGHAGAVKAVNIRGNLAILGV
jgi:hypothetical protein